MIGKKKVSQIKSLTQKKARLKEQLFLVEGDKIVLEVLHSHLHVMELFATESFIRQNEQLVYGAEKVIATTENDIRKASLLKSPQSSLALCHLPSKMELPQKLSGISFYLDGVQDPGNLGTILRICDWFGMEYLFCSADTADIYNPKVIQSSMGSVFRTETVYTNHKDLFDLAVQSGIPVFGAFMEGNNLYTLDLPSKALIVMGNEGNGIRPEVAEKIDKRVNIPSFSKGNQGAESLNVAVAAGIVASEFRRQNTTFPVIQNGN